MSVRLQIEYIVNNRKPDGRHKTYQVTQTEQRISPECKKEAMAKIPISLVKYGELTAASKLRCNSFGALKDVMFVCTIVPTVGSTFLDCKSFES